MRAVARVRTALGDLGIWSGFYGAGCVLAVFVLADTPVRWAGVLGAGMATSAVYLVDRVKLRDRDWDPADLDADARRHAWLRAHKHACRVLALAMLAVASLLLGTRGWSSGLLPWGGLVAVLGYTAGARHGARPKDLLTLKSVAVACGLTLLAWVVVDGGDDLGARAWGGVLGWVWLVVLGDAVLSDLDDRETDRQWHTRTLWVVAGAGVSWAVAIVAHLGASVVLFWGVVGPAPELVGLSLPASTLCLWAGRPRRVRAWVDLRLAVLAGAAWVIL
ncbi:MAG: hypothetical protein ACF8Q5_11580 [Phycisphaerales bacterium JB040]